jgi:aspartate/methionine/tyrosine aminotransferase
LLVISDEVYEHMVFDGLEHVRFAALNNGEMFDRTMTVFSAGKTFSCTGWRVGYFVAPSRLALPLIKAQSVVAFASATPLELAVSGAMACAEEEGYFDSFPPMLQAKRDRMVNTLRSVGMKPIVPQGGYFTMIDSSDMELADTATTEWTAATPLHERRDYQLAVQLTKTVGITPIPPSPFYSPHNRHLADNMLRLAYCKRDEEIDAVAATLSDAQAAGMIK